MMLSTRLMAAGLAFSGLLAACNNSLDGGKAVNSSANVSGVVLDEKGTGIAGVAVKVGTGATAAVTAADGTYSATAAGAVGASLPVSLVAPGHANLTSQLYLGGLAVKQNFVMRTYEATSTVTLPETGGVAVDVTLQKASGNVILSLPAGSLVKADGTVVTGAVQVNLTAWPAGEANSAIPAPLQGVLSDGSANANAVRDLYTLGMADIEILQGTDQLQIVPGKWLVVHFPLSTAAAAAAASISATDDGAPGLWYADHEVGAWRRTTDTYGNPNIAFDAASSSIVARIPHLSAWNIDGISTPNACVKGSITDNCGKAVASSKMTLWVYGGQGGGELAYYPFTTNADGTFCATMTGGGDSDKDASGIYHAQAYMWVSAENDPNSASCNPTGAITFAQLCKRANSGQANLCAGADVQNNEGAAAFKDTSGFTKCNIPYTTLNLCGYCPGTDVGNRTCLVSGNTIRAGGALVSGQCTDLGALKVGYCGSPNTTPSACTTAGNQPHAGSLCSVTADCCAPGVLECADATCVPVQAK